MQVIIPMSGSGQRFLDSGYTEIKPLIKISEKPMIEYVTSLFPSDSDFLFICREDHIKTTNLKNELLRIQPNSKIKEIQSHKLGPVHAVLQALDEIENDTPIWISYCDYNMIWDFHEINIFLQAGNYSGAVVCYKGFHPHLIRSNVYAGCRLDSFGNLLEIREKYSFTIDKTQSAHSTGTYYFSNKKILEKYFNELYISNKKINGEFYISTVFEFMLNDNLHIYAPTIPFFCQWGTPSDLQEYLAWENLFKGK